MTYSINEREPLFFVPHPSRRARIRTTEPSSLLTAQSIYMIFSNDRNELRQMYVNAWRKRGAKLPLEPLETQIAAVVERHPEYHKMLLSSEKAVAKDYSPEMGEANPFLHMGMHLAIQEQVSIDRPPGVKAVFGDLLEKLGDAHEAEHQMAECLVESIWKSQRDKVQPDLAAYLASLQALLLK